VSVWASERRFASTGIQWRFIFCYGAWARAGIKAVALCSTSTNSSTEWAGRQSINVIRGSGRRIAMYSNTLV
jgi:hypothetical protein